MENTSRGNRLHIGFYGRTNVGKSTLINKITNQNSSIVSEQKGTTTDVVYKPMELLPIGSVVFMDTAGLDDETELGEQRIQKTLQTLMKADVAVIVCDNEGWNKFELELFEKTKSYNTEHIIAIVTNTDKKNITDEKLEEIKKYAKNVILTDLNDKNIIEKFKEELIKVLPKDFVEQKKITADLVKENDTVVLVIPIDKEAPKGRLILPQVQTIRELLDLSAKIIVVKVSELRNILEELKNPPQLVITDSQAFEEVSEIVPDNIALTSFSILFANLKGDIDTFTKGAKAVKNLQNGDKILIFESCTHHAIDDDIARVKIPKLLKAKTGIDLKFNYHSGGEMPENIKEYSMIIHCGACMTNSKEVLSRIMIAERLNIPITNYGIIIAYCLGILDRAISPLNIK